MIPLMSSMSLVLADFCLIFTSSEGSGESCPRVGGGGGTLIFSAYVGSDPASTVHPKKISGILNTPKKYLKF